MAVASVSTRAHEQQDGTVGKARLVPPGLGRLQPGALKFRFEVPAMLSRRGLVVR
jgi:hypothetical protein